ncbi:hypothetical protein CANARDRAFT_84786 [[Candida] arabinofermentans NRRL YB-2248]|uniref:Uncharacterized protein n=1 Tax=[Candida] arabinofermentans NRRL YB-2248 TaxID=983967 RepID=A0A1E4T5P5_9ASCO|nr:hypothetical protein CANARDRAFT_84786 [[Candida] arabinofermentans NRRL YB-2248]
MQVYNPNPFLVTTTCGICHDTTHGNHRSATNKISYYCPSCLNFKILKVKLNLVNLEFFNSRASDEINKVLDDCIKGHSAGFLRKYLNNEIDLNLHSGNQELEGLTPSLDAIARLSYMLLNVETTLFKRNLNLIRHNNQKQRVNNESIRFRIKSMRELVRERKQELINKKNELEKSHQISVETINNVTIDIKESKLNKTDKLISNTRLNHLKELIKICHVEVLPHGVKAKNECDVRETTTDDRLSVSTLKPKSISFSLDKLNETLTAGLKQKQMDLTSDTNNSNEINSTIFFTPVIPIQKYLNYSIPSINDSLQKLSLFISLASEYLDFELPFPIIMNHGIDDEDLAEEKTQSPSSKITKGPDDEVIVTRQDEMERDVDLEQTANMDDDEHSEKDSDEADIGQEEGHASNKLDSDSESSEVKEDRLNLLFKPVIGNKLQTEKFLLYATTHSDNGNNITSLVEFDKQRLELFSNALARLLLDLIALLTHLKPGISPESFEFNNMLRLDALVEQLVEGVIAGDKDAETTTSKESKVRNTKVDSEITRKPAKRGFTSVFNFWRGGSLKEASTTGNDDQSTLNSEKTDDSTSHYESELEIPQFDSKFLADYMADEKIDIGSKLASINLSVSFISSDSTSSMINPEDTSSYPSSLTKVKTSDADMNSELFSDSGRLSMLIYNYFKSEMLKQIESELTGNTVSSMGLSLSSTVTSAFQQINGINSTDSMSRERREFTSDGTNSPKYKGKPVSSTSLVSINQKNIGLPTTATTTPSSTNTTASTLNQTSGNRHTNELRFLQQVPPIQRKTRFQVAGLNPGSMSMTPAPDNSGVKGSRGTGSRSPHKSPKASSKSKAKSRSDHWEVI